jgi:hypothetical protein
MHKFLLSVVALTFCVTSFGEFYPDFKKSVNLNRRKKYPIGINAIGFGSSRYVGASIDWFITPKINIEGGIGIEEYIDFSPNSFIGVKYHIFGKTVTNLTPYVGIFGIASPLNSSNQQLLYFPIGIQKIKRNKLTWSAEIGYRINLNVNQNNWWGGFKIGYRFSRIKK